MLLDIYENVDLEKLKRSMNYTEKNVNIILLENLILITKGLCIYKFLVV